MDVYLVPIAPDRYELYCEVPDEPEETADEPSSGFFRRMKTRFASMLAEAERERHRGRVDHDEESRGVLARVKARMLRWVAESIAEQRLLWHLRGQSAACLHYPSDLDETPATALLRRQLGRDFGRHRFWLAIDSLLFVASGLLVLLPGPNVVAYYFAFRMVGHFLSLRGARQGLNIVAWRGERSAPLAELRGAFGLDAEERDRRVHLVASALKLEHLVKFFERTAIPSA